MAWVILTLTMLPLFKLDRFTRRDIRKYNREIRKVEKENNKWLEDRLEGNMLRELLSLQKVGLAHTPK
tara:strand:+ start:205 stop:408 length:204 start_codon:yes stop_codon:yes gene_type:complete